MKINKPFLICLIILLVFTRTYLESYMVQLGLKTSDYSDFVGCNIMGCYLKFKYQIILDILSFGTYFILLKQFLKYTNRNAIVKSVAFVLIFMIIPLYELMGSLIGRIVPETFLKSLEWNDALYWSFEGFIGMLASILIMTLILKKILKQVEIPAE